MTSKPIDHAETKTQFKALWDFVFLSGGESIGKVAGFLAFAYLARTLDSASYGAVELAVAMLAIFGLLIDFGFGQIGAREVSQSPQNAEHWAALIPGTRLLGSLICIPLMCFMAIMMDLPEKDMHLIWIVSFALLAKVWNQVWLMQGLEKMGMVSFNQAMRMSVFAIGVFLFVKSDDDLLRVGVIELIAAASMATFLLYLQRREGIAIRMSLSIKDIAKLTKRSSSIGFSQAVWALNQYISIIMVTYIAGAIAGAWFAAAHRIVNALTSYSLVYHFNLFPATSLRLGQSVVAYDELAQSSTRVVAWVGTAVALVSSLLATPICVLIFGAQFHEAGLSLAVLAWSVPITLMSGHGRFALIATENQRYVLAAQSGGAVATVIIGVLLIPIYGPVGASFSMVLSHAVVWIIVHHFICKKVCSIPAIKVVALPILVAAVSFIICYLTDFSALGVLSSLLVFSVLALTLDRRLITAAKTLSKIKNQNYQIES